MLSPIQTKRHWLQRVEFSVLEQPQDENDYDFQLTLKHQKVDDYWQVGLEVCFDGKDQSSVEYKGIVAYEGIFEIHPDMPQEKIEDLVRMNGGAILYAAVREHVLGLTARSRYGPFELPTIDARMFIQKEKISEKVDEA